VGVVAGAEEQRARDSSVGGGRGNGLASSGGASRQCRSIGLLRFRSDSWGLGIGAGPRVAKYFAASTGLLQATWLAAVSASTQVLLALALSWCRSLADSDLIVCRPQVYYTTRSVAGLPNQILIMPSHPV
jgi:hypothetical protein